MISREGAMPHLQPLAEPILEAFTEALSEARRGQEAMAAGRARCPTPVRNLIDGVTFWGVFASLLDARLILIEGVAREIAGNALAHTWTVGEGLRLRLKSDPTSIESEQLVIPQLERMEGEERALIVLAWRHVGSGSFEPAFVHLTASGEQWRLPVAALLDVPPHPIAPQPVRARLSSRWAEERGADTDVER